MGLDNINLEVIEKFLGPPLKKVGSEYIWQCPICMDKSKDNLRYNPRKNILFCFADPNHSKLLLKKLWDNVKKQGKMLTIKHEDKEFPKQEEIVEETPLSIITIQKFKTYQYKCNRTLLNNKPLLKVLYKKRGITLDTVKDCCIGLDLQKERFVFPSVKFGSLNEVTGFEYRPLDLTKNGLFRERGTPTGLVQINSITNSTANLVVLEGYLDCYLFYQHIKALGQEQFYHIASPSNGVTSILRHFDSISDKLDRYKNVYLYLDSDEAGKKAMLELKQKYPQVETYSMACGCKDFNEHYLKCLKGKIP